MRHDIDGKEVYQRHDVDGLPDILVCTVYFLTFFYKNKIIKDKAGGSNNGGILSPLFNS